MKSEVPEHIRAAAREMNRKAFEERLRYDTLESHEFSYIEYKILFIGN